MLYNGEKEIDCHRAMERIKHLIKNKKVFELKEKKPKRTLSQNSYLHLILSWFALETGYTLEEVKQEIFKKIVNPQMFYEGEVDKGFVKIQRWRSSKNLDTSEMTLAIDRFRNYSSTEAGIYLPQPDDLTLLNEIRVELSKYESKEFL